MLAKDVMTKNVVCVRVDTSIRESIELCVQKGISGLVVVDHHDDIIGVVSEKDMLVAYDFLHEVKDPIKDFVSRDIISVSEDTSVDEINKTLLQRNIKRVPVLRGKKVVGIVSRRDVLRYILEKIKN